MSVVFAVSFSVGSSVDQLTQSGSRSVAVDQSVVVSSVDQASQSTESVSRAAADHSVSRGSLLSIILYTIHPS